MPSSIKKDFDYNITNLDWGDGSSIEYNKEPAQLGIDTVLTHTYEESGIYEIAILAANFSFFEMLSSDISSLII